MQSSRRGWSSALSASASAIRLIRTRRWGPLSCRAQYDRVKHYVTVALDEGATLLTGGRHPSGAQFRDGLFMEPTVFGKVRNDMRIAREEVFGPVVCLIPSPMRTRRSPSATPRYTVSLLVCGPGTSPELTASARSCAPEPCGSTPTGARATRSRSEESGKAAWAARTERRRSRNTRGQERLDRLGKWHRRSVQSACVSAARARCGLVDTF